MGRSRDIPGAALLALCLLGCGGGGEEDSTQPSAPRPLTWALAVDPACPYDVGMLADAAEAGLMRWTEAPSPLTLHFQGAGDVPIVADDGLQVLWIWWESGPWGGDSGALVEQWSYQGSGGVAVGFDVKVRGPACLPPGEEEGHVFNALANTAARGLGEGLGVLDPSGVGTPLSSGICVGDGPLFPTAAELAAL